MILSNDVMFKLLNEVKGLNDMEKNDYADLANKLLDLRKKAGFTQNRAAECLGVSRQTISKWEVGKSIPDSIMIKRICDCYKITPDEFFELLVVKDKQQSDMISYEREHIKKKYRLVITLLVIDFVLSIILIVYSQNMIFWIIYIQVLLLAAYIIYQIVHFIKYHMKERNIN